MKMLSEMECREALDDIYVLAIPCQEEVFEHRSQYLKERYILIKQLIKEHFDPQPYKFEELHEGMWVWDDVEKKCNKIININTVKLLLPTSNSDKKIGFYYITENPLRYIVEFEENRFFPVTKAKGE